MPVRHKIARSATLAASAAALFLVAFPGSALSRGVSIFGVKEEGGGSDAFQKIADFERGTERIMELQGVSAAERGFDGEYWSSVNGARTIIDLPSEVADREAERWIGQNIWKLRGGNRTSPLTINAKGASRLTVSFDQATDLPAQAVVQSDYGPVQFNFSDWRPVGKSLYPFLTERLTDNGEKLVLRAHSVRFVDTLDPQLLSRPAADRKSAKPGKASVVPFRRTGRGTHMLVDAIVDGTAGEFVFDTGAANIFTVDAARQRGIKVKGGLSISGVGEGSSEGGFAQVKSVKLGDIELTDQSFIIIPPIFPAVNDKPSPTQGLLGFEFFAHFVTTIDYKTNQLTFRNAIPPTQPGTRLPFTSDGHSIHVQARVNGLSGWFRIDTGDGGGVTLFPAFAARAGLQPDTPPQASQGGGVGGAVKEGHGILDRFEIGGETFDRLPVRFALNEKGAFASRFLAGNLGGRILSCFRMTLDHESHQIWLELQRDTPGCLAL